MKKTMFITSVIMVVVLAIALTTSSLAWFSAGGATSVEVNAFTVSAVTAQTVGAGLEISKDNSNWNTTPITLLHPVKQGQEAAANYVSEGGYWPACPVGTFTANTTTGGSVQDAATFRSAILNMYQTKTASIAGTVSFVEDATVAGLGVGYYKDNFFLRNSGTTDTYAALTLSASVSTHAGSGDTDIRDANLWVAVFAIYRNEQNNDQIDNVILLGLDDSKGNAQMTYAQNAAALSGSLSTPVDASTVTGVNGVSAASVLSLKANVQLLGGSNGAAVYNYGTPVEIEVYAWFDGNSMNAQNRDTVVTVEMTFNKSNS